MIGSVPGMVILWNVAQYQTGRHHCLHDQMILAEAQEFYYDSSVKQA